MTEPEAHPQGQIWQEVTEPRYAAISATGDSIITITNYYGGQLPTESTASLGRAGLVSDDECPCPYRELYPFDQNDAALFFGREAATERLRQALRRRNVLPLLGASGSGKSSLVFAGLVPLLHKEGHWCYSYFRPRESPFMELARALLPLYAPSLNETERLGQTEQLAAKLRKKEILLSNVLAEIRHKAPHDQLLLIGDQFEELYYPTLMQEERQAFLDVLFQAFAHDGLGGRKGANASAGSVRLLLTMRADFLGNALAHRSFAALFQQEGEGKDDVKLGPMSEVELREAIEKPAAAQGVAFESGLVELILSELATEPGHLPLLEFALTKLWSRRKGALITHEAYTEIGGVKGALAQHADGCLADLEPSQQVEARRVFLLLVRPGEGTEDTRRLATRQELGEDRWPLVCLLADDRLVVTSRNAVGDDTVEVVHEALIRHWGKMRGWLASDRDFRSWQERLRGSLAQWQANDHEEGGLLRGAALAVARAQLQERQEDLGNIEQDFIAASAAAEDEARRRERRRQRLLFSGLAGGLALVTVALMLAWGQLVRAQRQRGEALAATAKLTATDRPTDALIEALASAAFTRFGRLNTNNPIFPAIVTQAVIEGLEHNRELNRLQGHQGEIMSTEFSPDGQRIVSAGMDGTLRLWDANTGKTINIEHFFNKSWVWSTSFSRDGNIIVSTSQDGMIRLWDSKTGRAIGKPMDGHAGGVLSAAFSPDGRRIVSSGQDGTVRLWDVSTTTQIIKPLHGHERQVVSASFSPDGTMIASAGDDGTIRIWNISKGKEIIPPLRGHQAWVRSAVFSPDGKHLLSAGGDGTLRLWDARNGRPISKPQAGFSGVMWSAGFSADGKKIVSAGADGTIRIWDGLLKREIAQPLKGHKGEVRSASFSRDGKLIVSSGEDGTVRIWDAGQRLLLGELMPRHKGAVMQALFSPDGKRIVSAGQDGTVRQWNAYSGKIMAKPLRAHSTWVNSVAFSPIDTNLATAGHDGMIRIWDANNGKSIGLEIQGTDETKYFRGIVRSVAFSPDGSRIVSAVNDGTVRIWDVASGSLIGRIPDWLERHIGGAWWALFNTNGSLVLSVGQDGSARIWDGRNGSLLRVFSKAHNQEVLAAAFSPDNKKIITGGDDGTVKIWNIGTGKAIGEALQSQQGVVRFVDWSPDGKRILTAGKDGTVRIWDARSHKAIGQPLFAHKGWVNSARFSPDGKRILTAGFDGSVRLWDINWTNPIRLACRSLRNHQILANPTTDLEKRARHVCVQWDPN